MRHWLAIAKSVDGLYYYVTPWIFSTEEAAKAELGNVYVRLATELPEIELPELVRNTNTYVPRIARASVTIKQGGISAAKRNKT